MAYIEDIMKLRGRFAEAITMGAINESKETIEAILIQIMNDAERSRQNCVTQSDNLRKQISTLDGQAAAFSSVSSIVFNIINGYLKIAEKNKEEEARLQAEKDERLQAEKEERARELEQSKEPEEIDNSGADTHEPGIQKTQNNTPELPKNLNRQKRR
jgi:cobalamin biosynthesis Mg chelatase CobN